MLAFHMLAIPAMGTGQSARGTQGWVDRTCHDAAARPALHPPKPMPTCARLQVPCKGCCERQ